jgi:hypothetical protein
MSNGDVIRSQEPGLDRLTQRVINYLLANKQEVPDHIMEVVEDQICTRQPEGRCRYEKKAGDMLALGIHAAAGVLDKAAKAIGLKTNIKQKARGCGSCGQRRVTMNNAFSR